MYIDLLKTRLYLNNDSLLNAIIIDYILCSLCGVNK